MTFNPAKWDWDNPFLFVGTFMVAIGLVIFFVIVFAMWIGWHQSAVSCHAYELQTGRQTRWVQFNWWDRVCLVRTSGNHWIPIDQFRGVTGAA